LIGKSETFLSEKRKNKNQVTLTRVAFFLVLRCQKKLNFVAVPILQPIPTRNPKNPPQVAHDAAMSDVKAWVEDKLHQLVGFSHKNVVDFMVELAKKERDPNGLAKKLVSLADLPDDPRTHDFSRELLSRLPTQQQSRSSTYEAEIREKAALAKRNTKYKLIDDDLPPTPSSTLSATPSGALVAAAMAAAKEKADKEQADKEKADSKSKKNLRKRQRSPSPTPASPKKEEEEKVDSEEERARDLKERDEFAERVKKRDEGKTKKTGAGAAAEKPSKVTSLDDLKKQLPDLREASRQKYLKMRLDQKLDDLELELMEEETFWDPDELTEQEKRRIEIKRNALKYARAQAEKEVAEEDDTVYNMPDSYEQDDGRINREKQMAALNRRYRDKPEDPNKNEQYYWEEDQLRKANMKVGAYGGEQENKNNSYDFVFEEDQIDFVSESVLAGEVGKSGGLKGEHSHEETAPDITEADDEMMRARKSLPVWPYREQLIQAVAEYQTIVIMGETGSGKTTQVAQFLIDAGYCNDGKKIGCTQPRRVAAMSVAARVAQEMGVKLGNEVGYSIRFEDCTSSRTILKYMTDGMLLREFLSEPDLAQYSVMILDEAHERTLHTDILFGLIKDIARFRSDIKILISSATLDAGKFSEYFDNAPVFIIPGRRYPVDIYYTKAPEADYIDAAVVTVLQIHVTQSSGDVLVFLTGQEEIETMGEVLLQRTRGLGSKVGELIILPIYSTLPTDMQAKIFEPTPPGARKVILATNIAETSITIDNIIYVVDPGFSKQTSYNPRTGMDSLIVTPISKASASQRAGRAGRVAPGKCFRLYTAWAYQNELEDNTIPEIQRTNLGNVVLMLKSLGIDDLIHFDFMDPPPAETLIKALEMLYALGALNDHGELTKLGRRMAEFPMDPMLSKTVLQSEKYKCTNAILDIVAMLSVNNVIFYRPKDKKIHADNARKNFHKVGGDHMTLLNVYMQWADTGFSAQWCFENFIQVRSMKRARDVREQLEGLCERVEINLEDKSDVDPFHDNTGIRMAVTSGFFPHTSKLQKSGTYHTVKHNQTVHVHPQSALFEELPRWVVYHELVFTTKEYMRQILEIEPKWLVEIAPHFYKEKDIHDPTLIKMPRKPGKSGA
jgi:pre-mRNA-splicing factor ATP-dependent RNA helicase DHX16